MIQAKGTQLNNVFSTLSLRTRYKYKLEGIAELRLKEACNNKTSNKAIHFKTRMPICSYKDKTHCKNKWLPMIRLTIILSLLRKERLNLLDH
jgi:hypothetical protein